MVNRFQRVAGFDRSMALASSALTALIPLAVLGATVLTRFGPPDVASRIINRYGLTGGGATAVRQLFEPSVATDGGLDILGLLFLLLSVLSFTRATQRLFEQAWELKPLSVRNTPNGLRWVLGLACYLTVTGWVWVALGGTPFGLAASLCEVPLTAVFLGWSGRVLSARRIGRRDLLPFGVIVAVLEAAYSVGTTVYLPHLFSSYATRYGSVGAVFAMLSALFGLMFVFVGSAALGREVAVELDRIRHGRRPPDDEVRHQWDVLLEQLRSRWRSARGQLPSRDRRDPGPAGPPEN
ncbi:YhjD/YihY/BrkB family envelope integrity protein [Kitasatospora sp. NPDC048540]|uniref:YhjD/YihY/BrkB family envelope integrity protein n=1 Tax=unclassified Kitasatospora TaxID=2633591 RepID=UPI000A691379|nr:YhjD/YihY/BrkB family envelope integrity protein [Kitasatospora sp. MBT63]